MFYVTYSANPDTSGWDTSSVTNMSQMFGGATSANPDTSGWNTSAVTDMSRMFGNASGNVTSANPDTSNWDTSAVTDMNGMFSGSPANPDTSGWDTSAVTDMYGMFSGSSTDPDTGGWDTASVTNMSYMFYRATSANPDTSGWDTSSVKGMSGMFYNATSANPDTSGWDTSAVTDMRDMFYKATSANPDTGGWNTSSVMGMSGMFYNATSANPDTSGWDTSAVTDTVEMFRNAFSFDQDLGSWNVSSLGYAARMFDGVTLSTANYESLLIGWNAQTLQSGVTFSGGSSKYCSAAAITARANMVESDAWIITDGGNDCTPVFRINAGLNDAWYLPDTSGQGFFITVFPDLDAVSLAWFTYDTELPPDDATANLGDPGHRWITAIGQIDGNQVVMDIDITSGGIFDTVTVVEHTDPPGSDGTLILTFDSCNSGTVEYDIPSINRQGLIPITRVANDNIVICEALSTD
jgi:surface protein